MELDLLFDDSPACTVVKVEGAEAASMIEPDVSTQPSFFPLVTGATICALPDMQSKAQGPADFAESVTESRQLPQLSGVADDRAQGGAEFMVKEFELTTFGRQNLFGNRPKRTHVYGVGLTIINGEFKGAAATGPSSLEQILTR